MSIKPQHATPADWAWLEGNSTVDRCDAAWSRGLITVRARIEALEAGATCPHVRTGDEGTSYCGLAEQVAAMESPAPPASSLVKRRPLRCPTPATIAECGGPCEQGFHLCDCGLLEQLNPELRGPAPASSLVERVARAIANVGGDTDSYDPEARAAIRRVAAAARAQDSKHRDPSGVPELVTWETVALWLEQEADR